MKNYIFFTFCSVFILLFFSLSFASPESDERAKKFLETYLNSPDNGVNFFLGDYSIVNQLGKQDISQGYISEKNFQLYLEAKKNGLLTIEKDKSYEEFKSGKIKSIPEAMKLGGTAMMITSKVKIEATQKGLEVAKKSGWPLRENVLNIKVGKFTVINIVKNEIIDNKINKYGLLMANFKVDFDYEAKKILDFSDYTKNVNKKIIALFKYDDFRKASFRISQDITDVDKDFKTNNVEQSIKTILK